MFFQPSASLAILASHTLASIKLAGNIPENFHAQSRSRYCFFSAVYLVTLQSSTILCTILNEAEKFRMLLLYCGSFLLIFDILQIHPMNTHLGEVYLGWKSSAAFPQVFSKASFFSQILTTNYFDVFFDHCLFFQSLPILSLLLFEELDLLGKYILLHYNNWCAQFSFLEVD